MLCCVSTWRLLVILAVMVLFTAVTASAQTCVAPCVIGGSDYFQTTAASVSLPASYTNAPPNGYGFPSSIPLTTLPNFNNPLGGFVDTIVQRQEDAAVNGAAVPSQLLDLSLIAVGVRDGSDYHYNVYVYLDPTALPVNTGMITINGDGTGGTFTTCSTSGYYFEVDFEPTDGGPAIPRFTNATQPPATATPCTLGCGNGPFTWSATPPANSFLLSGPYPAFNANQHNSVSMPPPVGYVDFYFTGTATESCSVTGSFGTFAFSQTVQQAPMSTTRPKGKTTAHNGGSESKARK